MQLIMGYRVILDFKVYKFDSYSKALLFKQQNGGVMYEQVPIKK
jgi:hypothetical protein